MKSDIISDLRRSRGLISSLTLGILMTRSELKSQVER